MVAISFSRTQFTFGASAEWGNGHYQFTGGTTLWGIAFSMLNIGLYIVLMRSVPSVIVNPMPGVVRRFAAFWLDFLLAMYIIGPLEGALLVLTEWSRTGIFAWTFERAIYARGDVVIGIVGVAISFVALLFYFALPVVFGKPSPAGCLLGYQIVCDPGRVPSLAMGLGRAALGFVAVCGIYISPFIFRERKNGKFWLDRVFKTHAVRIK